MNLPLIPLALTVLFIASQACQRGGGPGTSGQPKAAEGGKKDGEGTAGGRQKGADGAAGRGGRRDAGPTTVTVAPVTDGLIPIEVTVVAALAGRTQVDVYPKMTGRLARLGPAEGQAVRAGEVLFTIDRADPGESYLSAPVVSPVAGWIGRWVATSAGEQVSPATPVVTIVDDKALRATVNLPLHSWLQVTSSTKVDIRINGGTHPARVVSIARAADAASGRGRIIVEIDNPGQALRSGMVGHVTFALAPKQRRTIPAAALVLTESGAFVFVVEAGKARRVRIEYRMLALDLVEVLSGLDAGGSVVTAGANQLSDGAEVRVAEGKPG